MDQTIWWGNGYTTTVPLQVFTQRNFVTDFIKIAFEPPFGDVGVTYILHLYIARSKARGRLYIRHNWTFSYLIRLRRYEQKSVEVSVFRRGVGHFGRKFQTEGGVTHQPLLVSEWQSDCPFVWCQNIRSALCGFVTKHACDRQTDRQN